jgi:hypothetical protein
MDFKEVCKKLSAIRDYGSGEFYTTTSAANTFGWRFVDGKVAEYSINGGTWQGSIAVKASELVTTNNNRSYTWKFAKEKLSEVAVTPDWDSIYKRYSEEGIARHPEIVPAFQEEVDFLTQTYGKPSTVKAVSYHNAYGAQWERSELVWYAPDDTQIVAFERTEFNQQGQLGGVLFLSKESLNQTPKTKPDPYK